MKTLCLSVVAWMMLVAPAFTVTDRWESLPDTPFSFGVSAGGGLAADGRYLYAADFSGDGNGDFIDLNDNHEADAGESLLECGIANASVRFARFDPDAGTWDALPVIGPGGFGGDAFSSGNFNHPLFHAGGFLYYYQMRAGPNRCVLHRYDLAAFPNGAWEQVWDKSTSEAVMDQNAGMVGVMSPAGPVILHHGGGGAYRFCRTTGLAGGGAHVELTPEWPFTSAHFPRCGCWAFDALTGRLYHLSGDQLVSWMPRGTYPDASFLTTVPVSGSPLAVFETAIDSLKSTLEWDPGGTSVHPGVSLWGSSMVVVNDPSGVNGGPNGEDTGANVIYLVRGETSSDFWPYNEGRGQVGNGSYARWFPAAGEAQSLEPAPFHVGKGSDAVYLDGWVYLTQGETQNSPDGPGNHGPINGDGIRRPGRGFARFRIRRADYTSGPPVIPVSDYLGGGFAGVATDPQADGDPAHLFDRDESTACMSDTSNTVSITITFAGSTSVGAVRGWFGPDLYRWTLEAADTPADLVAATGSFVRVFDPEEVHGGGPHWREWNETPVVRRIFRFTIERSVGPPVQVSELELQYPKQVHLVEIDGSPTRVNHMEILPSEAYLLVGASQVLAAEVSLSLGPERYDVASRANWLTTDPAVAAVSNGVVEALRVGTSTLSAEFGPFSTEAPVHVVEPELHDDDISVAWIQRLPAMSYVWGSPEPQIEGWPPAGSIVTWRAWVRNEWPFPREEVDYRWLLNGETVAAGSVNLLADGFTHVDLTWMWSSDRHALQFVIDPHDAVREFSEENNIVDTWTDAITAGFWVEQSVYDYFHEHQRHLGVGSNGWEDWAQRQVARWNAAFAAATHPVDASGGVADRIRLDNIRVVADGELPLNGGLPTNNPDNSDRTTDLVWGFPASLLGGGMYSDHHTLSESNPFYFEGSLIHELGHARYLVDVYGFNVLDREDNRRVLIKQDGDFVAGTPLMPRTWMWWDHVFYIAGWAEAGPFHGLMNSPYTVIDRYSAMALNRIAGHRATRGNYNAPGNIGAFLDDLPERNTVQLVDRHGDPVTCATAHLYRATGAADWYGKEFDDLIDASFICDSNGCIEVGRNPFTDGGPIEHGYGISHAIAILRVDAGSRTGFAFLPAPWFHMEFWRGNTAHGHYQLEIPLIGEEPDIAQLLGFPHGDGRRLRVVAGGAVQPDSVIVDGVNAEYRHGAWWVTTGATGDTPSQISAAWPGGPTLTESYLPGAAPGPALTAQRTPVGLRFGWTSEPGNVYRVQHANALNAWPATAVGPDYFGTGGRLAVDEPAPTNRHRFTRLQVFRLND